MATPRPAPGTSALPITPRSTAAGAPAPLPRGVPSLTAPPAARNTPKAAVALSHPPAARTTAPSTPATATPGQAPAAAQTAIPAAAPIPASIPALVPAPIPAPAAERAAAKPAVSASTPTPSVAAPSAASNAANASSAAATAAAAPRRSAPFGGLGRRRTLRVRLGVQRIALELVGARDGARIAALGHPYGAVGDGLDRAMPTDLAQAVAALEPALTLLQTQLAARGLGSLRGVSCQVTIDDSWMLYDVVRADLRGLAPRAADTLIRASLADVAGVDPSEIVSRWQAQGASAHTLACGLPTGALPSLEQALRAQGLVLDSIEGEFVQTYNRYRERIDPKRSLIALVREAGAQLAVVIDGVLTTMSFEFGIGAPKELEMRGRGLVRAAGLGGDGAIRCYAFTPEGWKAPEPWICLPIGA